MTIQKRLKRPRSDGASAEGSEDEELGHEPAGVSPGDRTSVNHKSEACQLVGHPDQVGVLPELIQQIVLIGAVVPDCEAVIGGHVVKVKLDESFDDGAVPGTSEGQ